MTCSKCRICCGRGSGAAVSLFEEDAPVVTKAGLMRKLNIMASKQLVSLGYALGLRAVYCHNKVQHALTIPLSCFKVAVNPPNHKNARFLKTIKFYSVKSILGVSLK